MTEQMIHSAESLLAAGFQDGAVAKVTSIRVAPGQLDAHRSEGYVLGLRFLGTASAEPVEVEVAVNNLSNVDFEFDALALGGDVVLAETDGHIVFVPVAVEGKSEMVRKTMGYPGDLLTFLDNQAGLRGNDLASMIRQALYEWAIERGHHRHHRRRGGPGWGGHHFRFRKLKAVFQAVIDRIDSALPPNVTPAESREALGTTFAVEGGHPSPYPWGVIEQACATLCSMVRVPLMQADLNQWLVADLRSWVEERMQAPDANASSGLIKQQREVMETLADTLTQVFITRWLRGEGKGVEAEG